MNVKVGALAYVVLVGCFFMLLGISLQQSTELKYCYANSDNLIRLLKLEKSNE